MAGKMVIFSAPSGSGKTTLVHHLLSLPELNLAFSVSATSREKRPHEVAGTDYYFLSADEFKARIDAGEFVEWEEVYKDVFYGTLNSEVERIWSDGKHVIFDVDVVGGLNLKQMYGNRAMAVFVKPPSIGELKRRLEKRGTETSEKLQFRLDKAAEELSYAPKFDQIIVNEGLEQAKIDAVKLVRDFLNK
ncbi:MAG: guanylate kinase [Bacteroidetes bacterium]|jgi:guanylate kinase|nr:guanylate kinase [Bacteroidota bacterium]